MEEQSNCFLKRRQIVYMIYDGFKSSGTGEALLNYNNLMTVRLKSDNVQGFDTKWDETLHSMSKVPEEDILEHFAKHNSITQKN